MPRDAARDTALRPFAPGKLIRIANRSISVDIAPAAGGRIAQIARGAVEWLAGYSASNAAMIAWGSFPMLPWAGRMRRGRFDFQGRSYQLPLNLGDHAIHGVGFAMPWRIEQHSSDHVELALQLPQDERWPFGGSAHQRIEVGESTLRMQLSVTAGARAMPAAIGWHPWFRKPELTEFRPSSFYPRDAEGIAVRPLARPPPRPWDDCFINDKPILIHRYGECVRLTSSCSHWVVYDEPSHATCIEPQSGPPDAFNPDPPLLAPGATIAAWFLMEWL